MGLAPMAQPPGQGDLGAAIAGDQGPEDQDRGPHLLDQLVGGVGLLHGAPVDVDHRRGDLDLEAQRPQELGHRDDVPQVRHVAEGVVPVGQERGAEDGESGVLGAADGHLAFESSAAYDADVVHEAGR